MVILEKIMSTILRYSRVINHAVVSQKVDYSYTIMYKLQLYHKQFQTSSSIKLQTLNLHLRVIHSNKHQRLLYSLAWIAFNTTHFQRDQINNRTFVKVKHQQLDLIHKLRMT